jgi:hypothetical protein
MKDMSLKLDYFKYKDRLRELYPQCNDKELEEILYIRYGFWRIVIDDIN